MRKFVITVISGKFVYEISPTSRVQGPKSKNLKYPPQRTQRKNKTHRDYRIFYCFNSKFRIQNLKFLQLFPTI